MMENASIHMIHGQTGMVRVFVPPQQEADEPVPVEG